MLCFFSRSGDKTEFIHLFMLQCFPWPFTTDFVYSSVKNCLLFSAPSPCYGLLFFILLLFILPLILTGRVLLPLNSLSLKKLSCFSVLVLAMEVKGSICSQISRVVGTCGFVGIKVQPKIHETMCTMTSHCQIL